MMLRLDHVWRIYPSGDSEVVALQDVSLAIEDGDFVKVESRRGTTVVRALVVTTIRPDTVFIPYHWPLDRAANNCTVRAIDPVSLRDGGGRPLEHRGQELVRIEALPHQRYEQASRQLGAAVRAHGLNLQAGGRGSAANGIAPQRLQMLETQDHQAVGTGASRIMPDPTRAPRPRSRPWRSHSSRRS